MAASMHDPVMLTAVLNFLGIVDSQGIDISPQGNPASLRSSNRFREVIRICDNAALVLAKSHLKASLLELLKEVAAGFLLFSRRLRMLM